MTAESKKKRKIESLRKKIRRGSATPRDLLDFRRYSGKDASSVKQENKEQRAKRLKSNRLQQSARIKHETKEETERRQEADRIRSKLRRTHWTHGNNKEKQRLQEQLKSITKRSDRWKHETVGEWNDRLNQDMARRRQKRESERAQQKIREEMEQTMRKEEEIRARKAKERMKCFHHMLETEEKIREQRALFENRDARPFYLNDAELKLKLHQLEFDSIECYMELVELGKKDGFTIPENTKPSFLVTPPLDNYTTKWVGNVEFEWLMNKRMWVKRRRHQYKNTITSITKTLRSATEIIESEWLCDEESGNGEWQVRWKRVLEPSTSQVEPINVLTELKWVAVNENGGEWLPIYKRVYEPSVSRHHYKEFDYISSSGEWIERMKMIQMSRFEEFRHMENVDSAATGDPLLRVLAVDGRALRHV